MLLVSWIMDAVEKTAVVLEAGVLQAGVLL